MLMHRPLALALLAPNPKKFSAALGRTSPVVACPAMS